ncbi:MAG: hypothetical protein Q9224_003879, partial [Gallowayella concinna]
MTKLHYAPSSQISVPADIAMDAGVHKHIVPGGHGHAFEVQKGTSFRIVDLHGLQIVDMMAWVLPYPSSLEHLSMSYTRYSLNGSAPPAVGDYLVTNKQEPIFKLTADVCHTHDMTFMACNPAFYAEKGLVGHRSCAENIAEAMRPWGMRSYLEATAVDPFNVFQNTPDMTLKDLGCSRAGDYVEFEVLKDAVVGVSSCPYDVDGFGGGQATEVAVLTGLKPSR